jgi:hypothetical protein
LEFCAALGVRNFTRLLYLLAQTWQAAHQNLGNRSGSAERSAHAVLDTVPVLGSVRAGLVQRISFATSFCARNDKQEMLLTEIRDLLKAGQQR